MIRAIASLVLLALIGSARGDEITELRDGPGRREAWEKVVAQGPSALPRLLQAMDGAGTPAANWLRSAFDRIVDVERAAGGKRIDVDRMLAFAKDAKHSGRARRLAMNLVEQKRPGTYAKLVAGWIDDPEFRYEAVADVAKSADALEQAGKKPQALAEFQRAFTASRDLNQAKSLAVRLHKFDDAVSVARHFGFHMREAHHS